MLPKCVRDIFERFASTSKREDEDEDMDMDTFKLLCEAHKNGILSATLTNDQIRLVRKRLFNE